MHESKLSASATVYFPKMIEEKCEGNDNAFNKLDKTKKCVSTKCFDTKSQIKEDHDLQNEKNDMLIDANNNEHKVLSCEDEKVYEKEDHTTACEEESSLVM